MKQFFFVLIVAVSLSACQQGASFYEGEFSYKTSGSVQVAGDGNETTKSIETTIGQLSIVDLKAEKNDSVLLVFNALKGDLRTVRASVSGDTLRLQPYEMCLQLPNSPVEYNVKVTGSGVRYDNTIVITENYVGKSTGSATNSTVSSNEILTVATRN